MGTTTSNMERRTDMTRRTKAPTPLPIKIIEKCAHKNYMCHECELEFTVYWEGSAKHPFCPKCGENADVLLHPSKRRIQRAPKPRWSDDQLDELWDLYCNTGMTYTQIGEKIGRTKKSITHIIRKLRLAKYIPKEKI